MKKKTVKSNPKKRNAPSGRLKKETPKKASGKKSAGRAKTGAVLETTSPRATVGVVAPSSPAPLVELEIGATRLMNDGFEIYFHPQVKRVDGLFAGSDTERALALLDYAFDPDLQVVWAARGGYGAVRILPFLDEITTKVGLPEPKLLVGFSDATILLEYVRTKWGWRTIHGPMPATFHIERVKGSDWTRFTDLLSGDAYGFNFSLKAMYRPENFGAASGEKILGEVVGGNLAMLHSVAGTPYALDLEGKILFLEEVSEAPYRIDRMIQSLLLSRALDGVRAIVLGTFTDCRDSSPMVYASAPKGSGKAKMKPLRRTLSDHQALEVIFGDLGDALGIPVFFGLPVGHGNGTGSIELGIRAELSAKGILRSIL